jgi:hypothetical protein
MVPTPPRGADGMPAEHKQSKSASCDVRGYNLAMTLMRMLKQFGDDLSELIGDEM